MTLVDIDQSKGYLLDGKYAVKGVDECAEYVKIVRCWKCKYSEPNEFGDYDCTAHIPRFRVLGCGFCSIGEVRDESI